MVVSELRLHAVKLQYMHTVRVRQDAIVPLSSSRWRLRGCSLRSACGRTAAEAAHTSSDAARANLSSCISRALAMNRRQHTICSSSLSGGRTSGSYDVSPDSGDSRDGSSGSSDNETVPANSSASQTRSDQSDGIVAGTASASSNGAVGASSTGVAPVSVHLPVVRPIWACQTFISQRTHRGKPPQCG